ncbi:hypothetical protein [Melghirimyces algeriensis]|uniref:Uncharacterized protein n=1 Tax=Melghirimyces algeriensis TaxID=910412 RepID=A0A521BYY9_9BACL|nr:hypothetical protein [Melghirimyces algeriensis]SMO52393.1 hypothetical protein SAMN06264849_10314 [Melghirimyces algeriensis]
MMKASKIGLPPREQHPEAVRCCRDAHLNPPSDADSDKLDRFPDRYLRKQAVVDTTAVRGGLQMSTKVVPRKNTPFRP